MKAMTDHLHDASRHPQENYNKRAQLNTYIYEYFLRNGMFQCAQSILKADSDVNVQRHSPGSARNSKGSRLKKAVCNETTDTGLDSIHSNLLPAPNVPNLSADSCFLYEWFCLFWAMFNAQKNEDGRIEACQYACHIQQQNWPRWNVSWPQTHNPLLLLHTCDSASRNAFDNSNEMGVGIITPRILGFQTGDRSNQALQKFQMQLTSMEQQNKNELTARQGRSSLSRNDRIPVGKGSQGPIPSPKPCQRPALQASRPDALPDTTKQVKLGTQPMNDIIIDLPKAKIEGLGGNEGKTGHNWSVQWQNDSSETLIPWTSHPGVQGTQQELSRPPSVKPADANDSAKPRSTISSPSQTSKSTLPTPQLSKVARKKGLSPKRTTPKKRTMNVKDEMVTCKIPRLNVGSITTRPTKTTPKPVPHINPVGIRKDAQNISLAQVVPTAQPSVALPLSPASMAVNPPVELVQSATFGMEISKVSVTCSLF
ncbi:uncharacterized protein B0J16DRAFT_406929 [Fusarium flagelliforme]|uniref:uncharacterized protein n=1 Tax=Fusarium flagelliforme TaxID=2675880 RepID=UPI001E8E2723|nr:uncharacterized protein B0J16DRAFT_406929 [Fusarium flagelliforme]KAH7169841.1 hypothetical protein B0J16DRAFT_406929 [Fusarium flagelliforme]